MRKRIFVDGASRGNPGPSAIAFIEEGHAPGWGEYGGIIDGYKTNNEAEYIAVYAALHFVVSRAEVEIISDSILVVNQLRGSWKIKQKRLAALAEKINQMIDEKHLKVSYMWSDRTHPMIVRADKMCNEFLDTRTGARIPDPLEKRHERFAFVVDLGSRECWADARDILNSLAQSGDLYRKGKIVVSDVSRMEGLAPLGDDTNE